MRDPLLSVRNLCVDYITDSGPVRAIDGVSLEVHPGEILGVAGESGSGKSTLAKAILRILPPPAVISGGEVLFEGQNLLALNDAKLREIRWKRISMVFQSAMDALNPVIPVGEQIIDTLVARGSMQPAAARKRAIDLLEMVGIPGNRIDSFAHQLSGGMRQRTAIALALALEPSLVILDEPTTALDVVVEKEILEQILRLRNELGFAVMFITHDLARMLQLSDRLAVFYAAQLAELAPASVLKENARHPYTQGLLRAFPAIHGETEPVSIPGSPPSLAHPPRGCRFHPRCDQVLDRCRTEAPPAIALDEQHTAACHLVSED